MIDPAVQQWLDQIAAQPEDRTTQLVFMDWLEEEGREEAAAVRTARDAVEVLLEFPPEKMVLAPLPNSVPGQVRHVQWQQERLMVGQTLRPYWRLDGLTEWTLGTYELVIGAEAEVAVWILAKTMPHLWVNMYHASYKGPSGGRASVEYGWAVHKSNNLSICMRSDRPTEVAMRVQIGV